MVGWQGGLRRVLRKDESSMVFLVLIHTDLLEQATISRTATKKRHILFTTRADAKHLFDCTARNRPSHSVSGPPSH